MCKISVIVPVFNAENTVGACISSILEQTFSDFELLLVDDGSDDLSGAVCRNAENQDQRVRYIKKENGGAASARNLGMESAKGEYICFVDCDDYIDKAMLSFMYEKAQSENADIVMCGYLMENGTKISRISCNGGVYKGKEINEIIPEIKNKNLIDSPCNKLYRREFLQSTGLKMPENEAFEDTDFNLRLLLFSPVIAVFDECFYHYVLRMGSVTRRYKKDKLETMKKRARLLKECVDGQDGYCAYYYVKSVYSSLMDMFLECKHSEIFKCVKKECLDEEFKQNARSAKFGGKGAFLILCSAKTLNPIIVYLFCAGFYFLKYKLQGLFLRVRI